MSQKHYIQYNVNLLNNHNKIYVHDAITSHPLEAVLIIIVHDAY